MTAMIGTDSDSWLLEPIAPYLTRQIRMTTDPHLMRCVVVEVADRVVGGRPRHIGAGGA